MRFFVLFLVAVVSSCASLSLNDVYRQPSFNYLSTEFTSLSFSSLAGKSNIQIENRNPYDIPVTAMAVEFWLEGEPWLSVANEQSLSLPASGSATADFDWEIVFDQLITRAASAYSAGEVDLTMIVTPTLDVPVLGPQTLTWRSEFTVPVPKLPTLSVVGWSVSGVSLSSLQIALDFELNNPNVFGVDTQNWQLGIQNGTTAVAELRLSDARIEAGATQSQQVMLDIALADVGLLIFNALASSSWPESWQLDWSGLWSSPTLPMSLPDLNGSLSL